MQSPAKQLKTLSGHESAFYGKVLTFTNSKIGGVAVLLAALMMSGCATSPAAKEAKFLKAGRELASKNDHSRAILEFRNAMKSMPDDAEPYYQAGLSFLATGQVGEAIRAFNSALERDPKHAGAKLKITQMMASASDRDTVEEANTRLQDLLATAPPAPEVLTALALTEFKLSKPMDAERHLREAFEKFPNNWASATTLAKIQFDRGDFAGAEAILKKAAAQVPPSAAAFTSLGGFYAARNNPTEAERYFRRALDADPSDSRAMYYTGVLQVRQGKGDQAEETFRRASAMPHTQYPLLYARYLLQSGKTEAAISEFQRQWKDHPQDRGIRSQLIAALASVNRVSDAENILTTVLKANPKDTDAILQRSRLYIDARRFSDAQRDLAQLVRVENSAEAHYLLAKTYQGLAVPLRQRQELADAIALRRDFLSPRLELASLFVRDHSPKDALALLDEAPEQQKATLQFAVQRNWALLEARNIVDARKAIEAGLAASRLPDLLLQDGLLKLSDKRYEDARKSLREALVKAPDDTRILQAVVWTYVAQKNTASGIKEIEEYGRQRPNSARVQEFVGSLLLERGDYKQARAAFTAAKVADSKSVDIDLDLARLDDAEGKMEDALKRLTEIVAQHPDNVRAHLWKGNLEETKGNHQAATLDYRKVLELDAGNGTALNNLAFVLAEYENQSDEALGYAEKALELSPNDPTVRDTLGWVLFRKGVYDLAIKQLETSVNERGDVRSKYHLAMAYARAGQLARARTTLDAALRIDSNVPEAAQAKELVLKNK